jgi:hypothetical protein
MNSFCLDCSGKDPITRLRFEKLHPEGWRRPLWELIQGWVFWTLILPARDSLAEGCQRSLSIIEVFEFAIWACI